MKRVLVTFAMLVAVQLAWSQVSPKWARYPSISPDGSSIAFTYKGDLYRVSTNGGDAQQLTFHDAHDFMPVWSKDGKTIAFASDRYGNFDVFVMPAEGGAAKRLTYHSQDELPYSFDASGTAVVFGANRQDLASHRQYPTASQPELYKVPVEGGRVDLVLTVPAEYAQFSGDGRQVIYHDKKGGENEWRKYHRSSIARDIWVYDTTTNEHTQLTRFYGENRNPVFGDDDQSVYYLSEESGTFNIHKMMLDNSATPTQLTHLDTHPVRFLSRADNGLMSFSYDGELYTLREGSEPRKLAISIRTQEVSNSQRYTPIGNDIREMSVSPDGKEIAFIARGEVFVTSVEGKLTKRITNTPEQERFIQFAPDGKSILYASEREGRWQIYQAKKRRDNEPFFYAATVIDEAPLISNANDNYQPKLSPDGKKLAFIENRRTLKVLDLESKDSTTLLTPDQLFHMQDGDQYFMWSPDSKWLLATYRPTMANAEVVLLDVEGKRPMTNLTRSGYSDRMPKWVNDGKQVLWFSNRDGLKSHAASGGSQLDVYSLFLTRQEWERYNLDKDDFDLFKELEKAKKSEKPSDTTKRKEAKPVEIDWDGLHDRRARLTIHSSSLSDAALSKDGEKLFYLARFEKGANLWSTNLRTKETKMEIALDAGGGSLTWDKEMKNLYLLTGGRITKINPENNRRESISIAGEVFVDTEAEFRHAFDHVWLRTQKMFYTSDMHGADWEGLRALYAEYVPHLGNNYEFAEMISELLGELNVSHAGARYSGSIPNADATASLGVFMDYAHKGPGIRIEEVIKGGPLDRSNLLIKPGMVILSVDGDTVRTDRDAAYYLNRKAGKFTLLEIKDPSTGETDFHTVKPISLMEENRLLYRRWVRQNQAEVDSLSQGQLGYVHISGMNDGQYRNTYEEMMGKYADRKGVIVDTRFNGGGDLVADLAMFFTGEKFLEYATEDRSVGYEPTFRWTKPTLAMFNESNYSDGHCFACGYTDLNIGKTVGMPVPGTCSFAGWELLPNGVRWGAVPVSVKNKAGEWLENNETAPMFQVKNEPSVIAAGRDQQLEKAISELLKDTQ